MARRCGVLNIDPPRVLTACHPPAMCFAHRSYVPPRHRFVAPASIHVRAGSLDDWRPLGDFAFDERSKWLLAASGIVSDAAQRRSAKPTLDQARAIARSPKCRQYGRKLTVDLPNNAGRTSAAFYFINGRIVSLQATVLPANGDYDTPEMGRFVDSITFFTVLAPDDAIELPAPPK